MLAAEAHVMCRQYINRNVRVQLTSGHVYDGVVVHVDDQFVYLSVAGQTMYGAGGGGDCGCGCGGAKSARQPFYPFGYYPYYNNAIIPLSLFTLLAIALI